MFEHLLNLKIKLTGSNTLIKSGNSVLNLVAFYTGFIAKECVKISTGNLFVWKSANFADSYWFLYNDKNSLTETLVLK